MFTNKIKLFLLIHVMSTSLIPSLWAQNRIDPQKVLFGFEYTLQDQAMVDEPGRNTGYTQYKEGKMRELIGHFLAAEGRTLEQAWTLEGKEEREKPYHQEIEIQSRFGKVLFNTEPVVVEINYGPMKFDEVMERSQFLYEAAKKTGLVPYVQPGGERSGMGHIHVGGETLRQSPFHQHPHLLRNMLVYFHQHPSLLYGMGEAFDVGLKSNIETYHMSPRREALLEAIQEFDEWYLKVRQNPGQNEELQKGLQVFLRKLYEKDSGLIQFFAHYRVINIESFGPMVKDDQWILDQKGKYTVEFRGFRPPKNPETAKANAGLLLKIMEKLSDPELLVPTEGLEKENHFPSYAATRVKADWEIVTRELAINDPHLDQAIEEYFAIAWNGPNYPTPGLKEAKLISAISPKGQKGQNYELLVPMKKGEISPPRITFNGRQLSFLPLSLGREQYWMSYLQSHHLKVTADQIKGGLIPFKMKDGKATEEAEGDSLAVPGCYDQLTPRMLRQNDDLFVYLGRDVCAQCLGEEAGKNMYVPCKQCVPEFYYHPDLPAKTHQFALGSDGLPNVCREYEWGRFIRLVDLSYCQKELEGFNVEKEQWSYQWMEDRQTCAQYYPQKGMWKLSQYRSDCPNYYNPELPEVTYQLIPDQFTGQVLWCNKFIKGQFAEEVPSSYCQQEKMVNPYHYTYDHGDPADWSYEWMAGGAYCAKYNKKAHVWMYSYQRSNCRASFLEPSGGR